MANVALQDLVSGDEIVSDVYKIIDAGSGLLEVDGKMVKPGSENFGLFMPTHCGNHVLTRHQFLRVPTPLPRARTPTTAATMAPTTLLFSILLRASDGKRLKASPRRPTAVI